MTTIEIYSDDADRLDNVAEELDMSVAEIVSALMEYLDEVRNDYSIS